MLTGRRLDADRLCLNVGYAIRFLVVREGDEFDVAASGGHLRVDRAIGKLRCRVVILGGDPDHGARIQALDGREEHRALGGADLGKFAAPLMVTPVAGILRPYRPNSLWRSKWELLCLVRHALRQGLTHRPWRVVPANNLHRHGQATSAELGTHPGRPVGAV